MKTIALAVLGLCCALIGIGQAAAGDVGWGTSQPVAINCVVIDVATFGDRVHIHCGSVSKPVHVGGTDNDASDRYYAVETNSPMATNVVQSGLASLINNRPLEITYDSHPAHNPDGCLAQDCRRIISVVVR